MMTPQRWERIRSIVQPALELDPSEVEAWLERSCEGDGELRREAERLLRACRAADDSLPFLESPALELASPLWTAALPPELPEPLRPGVVVGPYTIERQIGRGGMGVVFLAHDQRLNRKVALKFLPPWLAASEDIARRFAQEAQAASRIDHPGIATVYEIDEASDGRVYIAMPYYEGETLQQRIARGPVGVATAVELARQMAEGLGAAHQHGIVHRDIKPGNVIITPGGRVKILDFGAAKIAGHQLTGPGTALGTVAYMSPEQARQDEVDARSDVWSLGVVLYEMLAGRRPFPARHPAAVLHGILHDDPPPVRTRRTGIPEGVALVVDRCLRKDPAARFADGSELARALGGVEVAGARAPGWSAFIRRPAGIALMMVAGVGLLVAGLVRVPSLLRDNGGVGTGSGATIAVLPLSPVGRDSALWQLGREMVVTLSQTLDGVGGITTVDPLAVLQRAPEPEPVSRNRGRALARQLRARSFLHGSLVREGGNVRINLGLFAADDGRLLARATTAAPADRIGAATDSASLAILQELWKGGGAPAPTPAAINTRSLPALRAYLEGEIAFARSEFTRSVQAFDRAFSADSTFVLAYWRSLYPRIYEGSRADSATVASILAHRDRLPDPERLMVDASATKTESGRLALFQDVTSRFSRYWPGWYAYADRLFHHGPYLGNTQGDALRAMERVVFLNPDFAIAWQHLLWIAALRRDTLVAGRAMAQLERFAARDAFLYHPDNMVYFRTLAALVQSGGELDDSAAARLARAALSGANRIPAPEITAVNLLAYGFPRAQIRMSEATLRENPPRPAVAAHWMGKMYAWASRGGWDSALTAAAQWTRLSDDPQAELRVYGLTVLGVLAGSIAPEVADRWRPAGRTAVARTPAWQAELAWLDGIRAYVTGDGDQLARSLQAVRRTGWSEADLLAVSLGAFQQHAAGEPAEAGRLLAALEWELAEDRLRIGIGRHHPYLSAVHRPSAARWLVEAGDTLQALRLLSWHEALLTSTDQVAAVRLGAANRTVAPLALYERARLEEARGRIGEARFHYLRFLERYDRPPPQHQPLVASARAALTILEP